MANFHPLKVIKLERLTDDCVALTFDIPEHLSETFHFLQGQHVTLKKDIDGQDTRRSYSICSCPFDSQLTVAIKKIDNGRFSTYANTFLKEGDELEVMPPHGNFYVPLDSKSERSYVAFAAGSGITPILSIIETTLRTEPKSRFTLFYGNQKTTSILFHERLEGLKNQFMGRFSLFHILSQEKQESDLFYGRIDAAKIKKYCQIFFDIHNVDHFFTCGPEEMMLAVKDELNRAGVDKSKIHLELFTSPVGKLGSKKADSNVEKAKAEITIVVDGTSISFPYDSQASILDVANEHDADLPYACKGGVCSTCVAKVEEGDVEMEVNYALEPDEIAKGMVLTCQARPKSDKVRLTFDI